MSRLGASLSLLLFLCNSSRAYYNASLFDDDDDFVDDDNLDELNWRKLLQQEKALHYRKNPVEKGTTYFTGGLRGGKGAAYLFDDGEEVVDLEPHVMGSMQGGNSVHECMRYVKRIIRKTRQEKIKEKMSTHGWEDGGHKRAQAPYWKEGDLLPEQPAYKRDFYDLPTLGQLDSRFKDYQCMSCSPVKATCPGGCTEDIIGLYTACDQWANCYDDTGDETWNHLFGGFILGFVLGFMFGALIGTTLGFDTMPSAVLGGLALAFLFMIIGATIGAGKGEFRCRKKDRRLPDGFYWDEERLHRDVWGDPDTYTWFSQEFAKCGCDAAMALQPQFFVLLVPILSFWTLLAPLW